MKQSRHKIAFLILFFLLLSLPALTMNHKANQVSAIDNRKLTDWSDYRGNTAEWLSSYVDDRIGGRESMILGYLLLNDHLFHELDHPLYTYGKEGHVFFKMHPNRTYTAYHDHFVDFVDGLRKYCQDRGIPFYFQFEPEKISTYRKYLPAGVNYQDRWVSTFLNKLRDRGISVVDNWSLLAEKAKAGEPVFNVKFNAGHWNDFGAYYGMNRLFRTMHSDFPAVNPLPMDFFKQESHVETTLPDMYFPIHESIPDLDLKEPFENLTEAYSKEVKINSHFPYFHLFRNQAQGAEVLPKVLIFQGSYLNSWNQFLIANTRESIGVHDYQNVLNAPYYINLFRPEAVVFELAEYTVEDYYFNEDKMIHMDFPPAMTPAQLSQKATQKTQLLRKVQADPKTYLTDYTLHVSAPNLRYAYLVSDDRVYDLQKETDGTFTLSVLKDSPLNLTNLRLYCCTQSGSWIRDDQAQALFRK